MTVSPEQTAPRIGIESALFELLKSVRASVTECGHYLDPGNGHLFLRLRFTAKDEMAVRNLLLTRAATLGFDWQMVALPICAPVVVLTSRFGHCTEDLFGRVARGELPMRVAALLSNHAAPATLAARAGVPFHHLDVKDAEREILHAVKSAGAELLILARYMQVLSADLLDALPCPAINIHHSLLPAFKGSHPYSRAYASGVRFIGATAHYVTPDLDEGPIIEQEVIRISHRDTLEDLKLAGRDLECRVLARAVHLHLERRVFVDQGRTIIL